MSTKEDGGSGREVRGVQYPADGLEAAIGMVAEIKAAIGLSAASRETLVEALGYKSINGASARKLAVLTHFGLLDRVGKGTSKISELGRRVLMPTSESDKAQAIAEAAKTPSLFGELFERFKGNAVPSLLPNLLAREFGVFHGAAESASKTFRETMEFAGLLRNGVLHEETESTTSSPAPQDGDGTAGTGSASDPGAPQPEGREDPVNAVTGVQKYTIALDGSGRVARIEIAIPVSAMDLRRVERWAKYMEEIVGEEVGE